MTTAEPDPFARPEDVRTALNVVFTESQERQCEMLLEGVSAIMRSRLPLLDSWLAQGLVSPVLARDCAIDMARTRIDITRARGLKSEQLPEHTVEFRDVPLTGADVTADWQDLLTPSEHRDSQTRGAWTIRPGVPCPRRPSL